MAENKYTSNIRVKINELRKEQNWSQEDLAEKAGLSQGAISQIENGKRVPTLVVIRKIADVFKISVEELIGEPEYSLVGDEKLQTFYRRYRRIDDLSDEDQNIVFEMIKRLKKE